MKIPNLAEKQYGRKILIGFLTPIVIMALNTVFCLIWGDETPLAFVLSMLCMGLCFVVVCCFQIEYASIIMAISEAMPTAIFFAMEAIPKHIEITGGPMSFYFGTLRFLLVRFGFYYSMAVFVLAQLVILTVFYIVRAVKNKYSCKWRIGQKRQI